MDFESYVHDSRTALLRFAVVLTDDPESAQDVVHDVLLRAQQQWARIGGVERPHAYGRRLGVNQVISAHRKLSRVEAWPAADLDTATADPTDAVDRRAALLQQLAGLPVKQRAAVVMRYLEDMADADIAAALDCSQSTVRVHIHRALQRLRVDLGSGAAVSHV